MEIETLRRRNIGAEYQSKVFKMLKQEKKFKFKTTKERFATFDAYNEKKKTVYEIKSSKRIFQHLPWIIIEPHKIEEFAKSNFKYLWHIIYYPETGDVYGAKIHKSNKFIEGVYEYYDPVYECKRHKLKIKKEYYERLWTFPIDCDILSSDED